MKKLTDTKLCKGRKEEKYLQLFKHPLLTPPLYESPLLTQTLYGAWNGFKAH